MKRLISILIITSVIFGMFAFSVSFADSTVQTEEYKTEIEFLKELQIMSDETDGEALIKRKEASKIITSMLYPGITFSNVSDNEKSVFSDVDVTDVYYPYIKFCKESGTINGYADGTFAPEKEITELELITILTNALGYSIIAESSGKYPAGVMNVARQSGMLDGVSFNAYEKVNVNKASKYIYNSLFCSLVTYDHITEDGVSVEINHAKNVISEKYDIKEYDAVIWDNGITALSGESSLDTERIGIRDIQGTKTIYAYDNGFGAGAYLGSRVRIFVKYNEYKGRNEIVYFSLHKRQNETTVISDDIINITDSYIEYEELRDSGKTKKISFGGMPPVVVINGIRKTQYSNEELVPDDGIMIVKDYNGDGKYDVLLVYNFNLKNGNKVPARNIVTDRVNAENCYIYCKFNPMANISFDEDDYIVSIVSEYGIKSVSDLKEFDIISVAEAEEKIDGKTFITLVVSRDVEKGILTSITQDSIYTTDELKISQSVLDIKSGYTSSLAINSEHTFYLDITGKVAYSQSASKKEVKYGYIMSAGKSNGFDKGLMIKLYTYEDDVLELEVSEKAIIDGKKYSDPDEQLAAVTKRPDGPSHLPGAEATIRRPVIYELSEDGRISRLDTDTPNYQTDRSSHNIYRTQNSIGYSDAEVDDKTALKAGFRNPHMYMVRMSNYSIEGKFFMNSDTLVMKVPDIDTFGINEFKKYGTADDYFTQEFDHRMVKLHEGNLVDENYMILPVTSLTYTNSYDIQGYDIDPDTGVAGLVVIRGRTDWYMSAISNDSRLYPLAVFDRVTDVYNEPREKMVKKIYYTIDGTENFAYFDPDEISFTQHYLLFGCDESYTPYNRSVEKLKSGDVIRIIKNGDWMSYLERVIKIADVKNTHAVLRYPMTSRYKYTTYEGDISYQQTKGMPNDVNGVYTTTSSNSVLGMMYVKSIKGNLITGYIPTNIQRRFLSTIDLNDDGTFTEQMMDTGTATLKVLEKKSDGTYRLRLGDLSEIETVSANDNLENADVLIYKHSHYSALELILVKQ